MAAPIPHIILAMDGLAAFHGAEPEKDEPTEDVQEAESILSRWAETVNAGRGSR